MEFDPGDDREEDDDNEGAGPPTPLNNTLGSIMDRTAAMSVAADDLAEIVEEYKRETPEMRLTLLPQLEALTVVAEEALRASIPLAQAEMALRQAKADDPVQVAPDFVPASEKAEQDEMKEDSTVNDDQEILAATRAQMEEILKVINEANELIGSNG